MVRFHRDEIRQGPVEWAGRSVTLVAERWTAWTATPWFGGAASYVRPVRIEEPDAEPVAVRDHVMIARLVALVLAIAIAVERRLFR